jgi:hypothetical protein
MSILKITRSVLLALSSLGVAGGCGGSFDDGFDDGAYQSYPESGNLAAATEVEAAVEVVAGDSTASNAADVTAPELGKARQALNKLCKDVVVNVTNRREEADGSRPAIKIKSLEFYNTRTGWHTESVTNRIISYGHDYPFVRSLENSQDDKITQWIVNFEYDLGSGWSSEVDDYMNTPDEYCQDSDTFELTVIEN